MFPKEKINKLYKNPNTRAFYKEYNNKCNPDKLLNISKKGIKLYEPLNSYKFNSPNIIDVSLKANQFFMIINLNQYRAFYKNIKKLDKTEKEKYISFLLYNRFLTKYTVWNTGLINYVISNNMPLNNLFWKLIFNKSIIYNYLNDDLYIFFKLIQFYGKNVIDFLNVYDYFYSNKKLLFMDFTRLSVINEEKFNKIILYIFSKNFIFN